MPAIRLPTPQDRYDYRNEAETRREIESVIRGINIGSSGLPGFYIVTANPYNATGDGVVDDTASLQAASDAAAAAGGGYLYIPPGRYKITADITVDRSVTVLGAGQEASVIYAASDFYLKLTGTGGYTHVISSLGFDSVGVKYGAAPGDEAQGAILAYCEIQNVAVGVTYTYNAYLTAIIYCQIHNNTTGVLFDFATAGTGSGAVMKITGTNLFNSVDAIIVNGITADGFDIKITDCDMEHNSGTCFKAVDAGDGSIYMTNVHIEASDGSGTTSYIDMQEGNLFIDGFWLYTSNATSPYTQIFKLDNETRVFVERARLQYESAATYGKLVTFLNTSGSGKDALLILDSDSIVTNIPFFGTGSQPLATASTSVGAILNGGSGLLPLGAGTPRVGAKMFAAQSNVTQALTYSATPATGTGHIAQLADMQASDKAPRVIEFDVETTALGGTNNLRISFQNAVGSLNLDLTLPVAAAGGHVKIHYTPGGAIDVYAHYNGTWVSARTTDNTTAQVRRFFVAYGISAGTNHTIFNLTEYVL